MVQLCVDWSECDPTTEIILHVVVGLVEPTGVVVPSQPYDRCTTIAAVTTTTFNNSFRRCCCCNGGDTIPRIIWLGGCSVLSKRLPGMCVCVFVQIRKDGSKDVYPAAKNQVYKVGTERFRITPSTNKSCSFFPDGTRKVTVL